MIADDMKTIAGRDKIREILKEAWNNKSHESFGAFLDEAAEKIPDGEWISVEEGYPEPYQSEIKKGGMTVQYSERIDKVIYSEFTSDFITADWIDLSIAALDQAGAAKKED